MRKWVEYITIGCVVFALGATIHITETLFSYLNIEIETIRFIFALGIIAGLCISWLARLFAWEAEKRMRGKNDENKDEKV